jgi:hypothetical protein
MDFTVIKDDNKLEDLYEIIKNLPDKSYNTFMADIQIAISNETATIMPTEMLRKAFKNLGR